MLIKVTDILYGLKNGLFLTLLLAVSSSGLAQIVGEDGTEVSSEKEKTTRDSLTGTTYYLTGLYNYGYRVFEDNSVYGSYEEWEAQEADMTGGGTIGLLMPLDKGLSLDFGLTYFGHKEKYNFSDTLTDSTFFFSNNYMQIGVPLKLRYTYGEKFQLFGFMGLTPLNILKVRYKSKYTREDGVIIENQVEIIKEKLSIFNVMATAGLGITYNLDWIGFTLYPEFRYHLINTYDPKQRPIIHKMYGLGVNAGITLRF
jgi:hypothetical protein